MLALLTLKKLIKLELVALYRLSAKSDGYTSKSWATRTLNFHSDVFDYLRSKWTLNQFYGTYNPFHLCPENAFFAPVNPDQVFILDLPMPYVTAQSLANDVIAAINEAIELDRANRFVKSSFALSLLWVAKYFRTIANDRSVSLEAYYDLHIASKKCEHLLSRILTGISDSFLSSPLGFASTARYINR